MINTITKTKLDVLPFKDIRKVADLTYWEGPLLSLFRNDDEANYIYYWCDSDDKHNRWLVFGVSQEQLTGYVVQKLSLLDLIRNPINNQTFILDTDGLGAHVNVELTSPINLPQDYQPEASVFYDPSDSVMYEQEINQEILAMLCTEIRNLRHSMRQYAPKRKVA